MPRTLLRFALVFALVSLAAPDARSAESETLLLQDPTVSGDHVVFVYAEDLWVVGRGGGVARRLTSGAGRESNPRLSPDGALVAFTGQYDGNTDVYVMPVEGGVPRRLTWHPGNDRVLGWHPDGKRVLFASPRAGGAPVDRLYLVDKEGGMPEALEVPKASHASFGATGARLAYTPMGDSFRTWKRYRGGRTGPVWIYDVKSREVEQIPHVNATDTFPCWLAGDVWFSSDRDGHMNVWRFTPGGKAPEQVTHFTDFDVRAMSSGGDVLAFEQAGALHLYDPKTKEDRRLRISVPSDGLSALPRWQEVKGFVRNTAIAPNGKRAAFEARGEIVTVPRENGDARNLTDSPGAHERNPAWSPDGTKIAWFSDEEGDYRLVVADAKSGGARKAYDLGGARFYYEPNWSPDGARILFGDKANRIAFLTLADGKFTDVASRQGSLGSFRPAATWSWDSRWIAFEQRDPDTTYDAIALYEVASGTTKVLTDGFTTAANPAFSRDGKHLFFAASVDSGPERFGLDMSAFSSRPSTVSLYVAVLQKDGKNPLAPKSDEAVEEKKDEGKKDGDEGKKKEGEGDKKDEKKDGDKPPKVEPLDVEGIGQRILALPLPAGTYLSLSCSKDAFLFVEEAKDESRTLKSFDFEKKKAEELLKGVTSFQVSADGKWLLLQEKEGWSIATSQGKDKKKLEIEAVRVRVEPEKEWPEMLRETWRLQRDFFYDPNMHGVDWPAMWERWSAFLPHVRHRSDLNLLISEMIGELCCGHEYVSGGESPKAPTGASVGLLGADFEAHEGRYRITRVYEGQNWNPGLRAPLTEPGVDARVGDHLISVNGRPVTAGENLYAAFDDTAGRQVELVLSANASGEPARTMTVVPLASDGELRRRAWIEDNRRRVDDLSGGRLAYVYMPNTANEGQAAFDRDYYSQIGKAGLVLDERYNGGGKVADYVISVLSRKPMCYWMTREGWLGRTPFGTMTGPKVMIINERAGSGGDAMPWLFRNLGIGPLVGMRTWGGLVGITGYPPLMDGGSVTSAAFGVMDVEGRWAVENVGVAPDYEVVEKPKDVIVGHDPQLEKAVEVALKLLEKSPPTTRPAYTPPTPR